MRCLVPARRAALFRALAVAALGLVSLPARAQTSLGVLDDASVLRRGMLRLDAILGVARAEERYGLNTPGRRNGSLEPLAADFIVADIGVTQFPGLASSEQEIRSASGLSNFVLSLGRPAISSEVSTTTVPMMLEMGVTSRLMIGVMVPYVRTRNNIRADFNPARSEGNAGINPAVIPGIARTTNTAFRNQVTSASSALREALDSCAANPASANCANLEANRTVAEALIAESRAFRDQVESIYGSDTASTPALFIPRVNSSAQLAIDARAASMNTLYRSLLGLSPDAVDPIAARPFAAQTPITAGQSQALFMDPDPRLGIAARPLETIERSHIGDIEVGAKFLLFDTFSNAAGRTAMRGAIGATLRLGTGEEDDPDNLVDVPTGDGQSDIELRSALDVSLAQRLMATVRARYTLQLPDRTTARITDAPGDVFAAAYRRQEVDRDLGDIIEIDVVPRYRFGDYFAVVGQYLIRRKAKDSYDGRFTIPSEITGIGDVELDASRLEAETQATEQRAGLGFTFSMQPSAAAGRTRTPIELSYLHSRTIRGSGGNQPKWAMDVLQVRITTSLFGR